MKSNRLKIHLSILFLIVMSICYIPSSRGALNTSSNGDTYSMPHVSIGDVLSWEVTRDEFDPEQIGLVMLLKIIDISEDDYYWRIYYLVKQPSETGYGSMERRVSLDKKSPVDLDGSGGVLYHFCPLPVDDYLEDYISFWAPSGYESSGNRLEYTWRLGIDEWIFSRDTGILISYTEKFLNGTIYYQLGDPPVSSDIPSFSGVIIITIICISTIILAKKTRSKKP